MCLKCTAASYVGLKKDVLPPYLDPNLRIEELMTGVSFASAGSGFDPLTPSMTVISHLLSFLTSLCCRLVVLVQKQSLSPLVFSYFMHLVIFTGTYIWAPIILLYT